MQDEIQSSDPKKQPRLGVLAQDGTLLSPAVPRSIRRMVKTGAATIERNERGDYFARMTRPVGKNVPHDLPADLQP